MIVGLNESYEYECTCLKLNFENAMVINRGLSTSAHVGRMTCIHALPCWGVRGGVEANTPTHAKYSYATL